MIDLKETDFWRQWGVSGMPKDKQRLAAAAFIAGMREAAWIAREVDRLGLSTAYVNRELKGQITELEKQNANAK